MAKGRLLDYMWLQVMIISRRFGSFHLHIEFKFVSTKLLIIHAINFFITCKGTTTDVKFMKTKQVFF